ncbi:MAG: hypothetical protein WBE68_17415 [Candidatus Nitrosopolaris sp.]
MLSGLVFVVMALAAVIGGFVLISNYVMPHAPILPEQIRCSTLL